MKFNLDSFGSGREHTAELLSRFGSLPLLTHKEEISFSEQVKDGSKEAFSKFVLHNIKLVVKIAAKYAGYGLEMDDLVSEGLIGLITAVRKYEPARGTRFSTYATYWIRQAVQRAAAGKSNLVRVPVHIHDAKYKINRIANKFQTENNREPTPEELAVLADIPVDKIKACLSHSKGVISLDEELGDDGDTSLGQLVAVDQETPEDNTASDIVTDKVDEIINSLPERNAYIIRHRFGIGGEPVLSLEQIGSELGITRERVRQIEKHTIKLLSKDPRFHAFVA